MAVKNLFLKDFFLDEITFHFCRHWLSLGGKTRYQCLFATKLNSSSARLISIKNRFSQSLQMMSQFTILWWPFLTLAFGQKRTSTRKKIPSPLQSWSWYLMGFVLLAQTLVAEENEYPEWAPFPPFYILSRCQLYVASATWNSSIK